jgi:hypothetical protein
MGFVLARYTLASVSARFEYDQVLQAYVHGATFRAFLSFPMERLGEDAQNSLNSPRNPTELFMGPYFLMCRMCTSVQRHVVISYFKTEPGNVNRMQDFIYWGHLLPYETFMPSSSAPPTSQQITAVSLDLLEKVPAIHFVFTHNCIKHKIPLWTPS